MTTLPNGVPARIPALGAVGAGLSAQPESAELRSRVRNDLLAAPRQLGRGLDLLAHGCELARLPAAQPRQREQAPSPPNLQQGQALLSLRATAARQQTAGQGRAHRRPRLAWAELVAYLQRPHLQDSPTRAHHLTCPSGRAGTQQALRLHQVPFERARRTSPASLRGRGGQVRTAARVGSDAAAVQVPRRISEMLPLVHYSFPQYYTAQASAWVFAAIAVVGVTSSPLDTCT